MGEAGEQVGDETVRSALDTVLRTPCFARSPKLASFLRFVVEEELAGRGAALKAYTIATRALGRGGDFDPSLDPSVRVEAGRLRRTLEEAHALAGPGLGVRIRIPVGTYRPQFEPVDVPRPVPAAELPEEAVPPPRLVIAFSPRGQAAIIALLSGILLLLCIEVGLMLGGAASPDRGAGRATSLAERLR
ncbi:hypothetical protein M446_3240 [Methylobacterium sp. 4-46]|uniref:hypothetical protein n=1 Tax=unclassified Methylobacterium TaxID=2615210 RepID=UPI000152BEBF|nr:MULTISPECIES: hypothetical protein [Methylobacterium]ACA17645.1 hypothetical protein M446_3240 [Methylobacterium sp. 4-46]WFT83316.1 hypothetical protein QA634_16425 [Methylobacterium nodulans]